jgi:hypothetical protein
VVVEGSSKARRLLGWAAAPVPRGVWWRGRVELLRRWGEMGKKRSGDEGGSQNPTKCRRVHEQPENVTSLEKWTSRLDLQRFFFPAPGPFSGLIFVGTLI